MRASGLRGPRPREDVGAASRTAASLVRLSRTPPTSDLCTMSGERIFTTTATLRQERAARRRRLLGIAGEQRGCNRNRIGREQPRHLDRIEPCAAALRRAFATTRARRGDVRREILRQARRRRHQASCASR